VPISHLAQSAALTSTTTASDCQTASGQIPDETEQGLDGFGGKDFEERWDMRRRWKTP